jgi:rhodanese-related sulfurtransferase
MSIDSAIHVPSVSRDELIAALSRGQAVLVDVLSPESFAAAHIDGAINLPVAQIAGRAAAVLPDRHAPIVVYCGGPT